MKKLLLLFVFLPLALMYAQPGQSRKATYGELRNAIDSVYTAMYDSVMAALLRISVNPTPAIDGLYFGTSTAHWYRAYIDSILNATIITPSTGSGITISTGSGDPAITITNTGVSISTGSSTVFSVTDTARLNGKNLDSLIADKSTADRVDVISNDSLIASMAASDDVTLQFLSKNSTTLFTLGFDERFKLTNGTGYVGVEYIPPYPELPDTTGKGVGLVPKYLGGGTITWSTDLTGGGAGGRDPDYSTIDTTALGELRIVPSLVTSWDSKQAGDADLDIYAGITPSANVQSLLGSASYAGMRTLLGLVIGTNVQAYDADLTIYAGITPSSDIQGFLGSADYATARTNLGVEIGKDVEAYDVDLTTWATITPGTGVATALGNEVDVSGGFATYDEIDSRTVAQSGASSMLIGYSGAFHNVTSTAYSDSLAKYGVKTESTDTLSFNWGVMDTVTAGDLPGYKMPNNITIVKVSAYTDVNTTTFDLEDRGATTPNSSGTNILSSALVADNNQEETTSFNSANVDKDHWIVPVISGTGDVAVFSITVYYIKR